MKALLLILALVVGAYGQSDLKLKTKSFKNNKRFEVSYDRFKNRTTVTAGPFFLRDLSFQMNANFTFEGETQTNPVKTVWLFFDTNFSNAQFLDERELFMIVDQERLSFGEGERTSRINSGGYSRYSRVTVSERLSFPIPLVLFQKIAKAKKVEIKVGRWELPLKEEHLVAFRDLLRLHMDWGEDSKS